VLAVFLADYTSRCRRLSVSGVSDVDEKILEGSDMAQGKSDWQRYTFFCGFRIIQDSLPIIGDNLRLCCVRQVAGPLSAAV